MNAATHRQRLPIRKHRQPLSPRLRLSHLSHLSRLSLLLHRLSLLRLRSQRNRLSLRMRRTRRRRSGHRIRASAIVTPPRMRNAPSMTKATTPRKAMRGETFRDVNVALSTSYRMAEYPAIDAGATRRALVTIAAVRPARSRIQADWVRELIGHPSRVVDLSGLTRLEARAQCALVRKAVTCRLSHAEAYAIIARYSLTPSEKQMGVSGLVAHVSAISRASHHADIFADPLANPVWDLLWRRYLPPRYGDGLALREIARRTHTSKSTLSRRAAELDVMLDELEWRALGTLEQSFVSEGLCEALSACMMQDQDQD
ncbi:hypothetical protein [Caballeronia sp. LZ035]|uniref:hypothetical protein n=1 Tax=Caballeronia sp. LZ035 TaxID=3038568 RepID=UPI0028552D84|nr:hypothetical protein [Caballeronia sp. LZ035]MDR5757886.1 hypothetical protein [Caballeronia sp. LZ035]